MKFKNILNEIEVLGQQKVIPLDQIDVDTARDAIRNGRKDKNQVDDVAMHKKAAISVKDLKPAQTEIIKEKAFGMAIEMLMKGKWDNQDLESIISKDNYIMDGHHRWAAVSLINPNAKIVGTIINLPGVALVSVLNIATKAMGKSGNPGKGDVASFTGANFDPLITNSMQNGIKGEFPIDSKTIIEAMGKVPGANGDAEKGKQIMMRNADSLPKIIMPGAPERINMPVIAPAEVSKVVAAISQGLIDFTKPYAPTTNVQQNKNMNELKLTSYGVKELLKAVFNRLDLLPKLGFDKFKHVIHHLKYGDQEEQNDLLKRLKELGVNVVYESKEDKLRKLVREEVAKIIKGKKQTK